MYSSFIKSSIKGILIIAIVSICNILSNEDFDHQSMEQCVQHIQKRNYVIHRLEHPIHTLLTVYESMLKKQHVSWSFFRSNIKSKTIIADTSSHHFQHPVIVHYVEKIEQAQNLEPMKELWSDFLSYKFLDSDLFAHEISILSIILYKNLISKVLEHYTKDVHHPFLMHDIDPNISMPRMLKIIDLMTNHFQDMQHSDKISTVLETSLIAHKVWRIIELADAQKKSYDSDHSIIHLIEESYEDADFLIFNNVRFYHIQRLVKSITLLSNEYKSDYEKCISNRRDHHMHFSHEAIKKCMEKIADSKKLDPLFDLWSEFTSYKFIDDTQFIKEFIIMLIFMYDKLNQKLHKEIKDISAIDRFEDSYIYSDRLTIPELLDNLDEGIEEVLNAYV